MRKILNSIMLALLWVSGGIFFFFLTLYIALSFLTKGFGRLFKRKGLYHFRESEFQSLNVVYDFEGSIPLGRLPTVKRETFTYHVPVAAKEVLLEFKFSTCPDNTCIEFDYCLWCNDSTFRKEYIYIFINPFDAVNLNYDKALVWYPLPADGILKVQFTDGKPSRPVYNMEGFLNVVQVR